MPRRIRSEIIGGHTQLRQEPRHQDATQGKREPGNTPGHPGEGIGLRGLLRRRDGTAGGRSYPCAALPKCPVDGHNFLADCYSPQEWLYPAFRRVKAKALRRTYSAAARTAWSSLVRFSEANSQLRSLPSTASRYLGRAF